MILSLNLVFFFILVKMNKGNIQNGVRKGELSGTTTYLISQALTGKSAPSTSPYGEAYSRTKILSSPSNRPSQ